MSRTPDQLDSEGVVCKVRSTLDDRSVMRPVRQLLYARDGRQQEVVLDLANVTFVYPSAIVTMATIFEQCAVADAKVRLICPKHSGCRSYFDTSGFLYYASSFVEIEGVDGPLDGAPSWRSDTVLPLTRLSGRQAVEGMLQQVEERLNSMMGQGSSAWRQAKQILRSTIMELCGNIYMHARTQTGWIAAQRYQNYHTGRPYIEIGIGDAGCGIRQSLAERFEQLSSEKESAVLNRMLVEGLSRRGGGNGYRTLQRATEMLDGQFAIRSGKGHLRRQRKRQEFECTEHGLAWPGTQLMVRLSPPS